MRLSLLICLAIIAGCASAPPKEMFLSSEGKGVQQQAVLLDPHSEIIMVDGEKINSFMQSKFHDKYYAIIIDPGIRRISRRMYINYDELSVVTYDIHVEEGFTYYCFSIPNKNVLKHLSCHQGPEGFAHPEPEKANQESLMSTVREVVNNKEAINVKLINCSPSIENMNIGYYREDHVYKELSECLNKVPKI
jgi:hypothetical protein